jgi:hypothetical protein
MMVSKLKAGALQLTMFIVVVIALLLASFVVLLQTHKRFNVQTDFVLETINNAQKGIDYALHNPTALNEIYSIGLNDEDYKTLTVKHDFWGMFEKLYATLLKKTKKEVDIESSLESESIKDIIDKLPKKQHAFLVINNEKVLTKKVESDQIEDLKLVYRAFPNITIDSFYYKIVKQGNLHFVSICRKDDVQELIIKYKAKGISIINLSLGSIAAFGICEYINSKTIFTSNAKLLKEDHTIISIENIVDVESQTYNINGVSVNNYQLLSFSGALNTLLNNSQSKSNFNEQQQLLLSDYKQKRFFSQFLKLGLIFLFGLLLINFFVFNHYFNKVNDLQQTSQINQTTKQTVLKLNERINKTQKMVDDMLKCSASKSSFYTNAIVQRLPSSILLSELNYQPLQKRIKTEQPIKVFNNILLISGSSSNSEDFSKWIVELDTNNWISTTEITSYEDVSKSVSKFSIKLSILND